MSTTTATTPRVPAPRAPRPAEESRPQESRPQESRPDAEELVDALRAGEEAAWRALVQRHRGLLLHIARRHGLGAHEAEDVVQETWARLFQHLGALRDPERLTSWAATTATRQCLAVHRRSRREQPGGPDAVEAACTWDVDEVLDARQRAAALRRAVARLPRRERALVEVLLEPEPPSYAQISARLAMPVGSIGPVRGRALRHLRALLAAQDDARLPVPA